LIHGLFIKGKKNMEKTPWSLSPTSYLLGELAKEGSGTGTMADALLVDLAKYPERRSDRSDWGMEDWQLGVLQLAINGD
jgi:hypothetical protein